MGSGRSGVDPTSVGRPTRKRKFEARMATYVEAAGSAQKLGTVWSGADMARGLVASS